MKQNEALGCAFSIVDMPKVSTRTAKSKGVYSPKSESTYPGLSQVGMLPESRII